MRLGLLGGTFDPVHYGHLLLAEQCREQCGLDEVWFVPASQPPHKQDVAVTSGKARAEMLEFATAGYPQFVVSRMELKREGPSFTVETLQALRDADPQRELYFLVGADSLADFRTWREPQRILELATVVAVNRGDAPLPDIDDWLATIDRRLHDRIRTVTMPGIELSASDIRQRVGEGRSIRFMVPRAVEAYISEHTLYRE